jgi:hypothetical protein
MNWQSMPKGSPERKAAVREQRRKFAAAARAKKARKRERDHYVPPEEVLNAGESERRRLLAEAVWWAFVNGADAEPPDEARRAMQKLKKQNEALFMKQFVLAVLPAPPKEAPLPPPEPERTEERIIGPEMGKLRRLLEDLHQGSSYRCPECGHTEDCSNESAERWEVWKGLQRPEDHQQGGLNGLAVDA